MNRYIRRRDEILLITVGTLLMFQEDRESAWGRIKEGDFFIVLEDDILFYQREDGSQEYGIAKYLPENKRLIWKAPSKEQIEIAKAHLLILEP